MISLYFGQGSMHEMNLVSTVRSLGSSGYMYLHKLQKENACYSIYFNALYISYTFHNEEKLCAFIQSQNN